jgi:lipopolysaccharide transport system ATP-binding protein
MNVLRKDDPFLKIGEVNDRAKKSASDYVWALKDINLEIEKGDVIGIIGKNGAGKSTLLKILSRVTKPTTGSISYRGRIASLLEVGTGFHPEMTGRENIYMNGAIMGMTRAEITRKFDEIVDFAGVERYIDTPTKRYSSGMTVRLGFAIAAHLEPEILVVDEVLAVGDAEFQKKAIGKMQDVSKGEGRTVLFVSHNMGAVSKLCSKAIILQNGFVVEEGITPIVISHYLSSGQQIIENELSKFKISKDLYQLSNFSFYHKEKFDMECIQGVPFRFSFDILNKSNEDFFIEFNVELKTTEGEPVTCFGNELQNFDIVVDAKQNKTITAIIDELTLKKGIYFVSLFFIVKKNQVVIDCQYVENITKIKVKEVSPLYFVQPNKNWRVFSNSIQHGYVGMKVDKFLST